jgi:hypothetical protein
MKCLGMGYFLSFVYFWLGHARAISFPQVMSFFALSQSAPVDVIFCLIGSNQTNLFIKVVIQLNVVAPNLLMQDLNI